MIKTRWLASLSNGETAIEGKERFAEIASEQSPWQKLLHYIGKNKLSITSLRIQVEKDGKTVNTFHLPTKSGGYRFSHLSSLKPIQFNYHRRLVQDVTAEQLASGRIDINTDAVSTEKFIEIDAIYDSVVMRILVDENTGTNSWVQLIPKNEYAW